jgi:hypothetical protein
MKTYMKYAGGIKYGEAKFRAPAAYLQENVVCTQRTKCWVKLRAGLVAKEKRTACALAWN